MGAFSEQVLEVGGSVYRRAAAEQAGLFSGLNPAHVNPNDPFVLWVIQTVIIIAMTQFLSLLLGRMRQPRVISEVIGGVILGPTVMGRIPHFTDKIFPASSLSYLSLTSTIGLVFYLFLVGLELDVRVVRRNAKASSLISIAGLVVPLGLGAAIAIPLYDQFIEDSINRGYFILFTAVAVGITAFPVLCRILTELKLLDTTVGILTLSAGVGNDVIGWVLLALAVALVNASTGLNALYVLLTGIGFIFFLLFPVKWAYHWIARRFGGLERGEPNAMMMTITLITVLFCAFFTDIIGIHAIFGGFLAGLLIPKVNGFEISMVEKLEDFVGLLFLPQYFALSGLRTNLGLLDNGATWGYTILTSVVAFFGKFISCFAAAKVFGFNIRESGAVGSLMACKGLVELIVLNVGLQAGILNTRVFSMFVLQALILTFITTPLVLWFYPERVRSSASATTEPSRRRDGDLPHNPKAGGDDFRTRFTMLLDRLEDIPAAMTFAQLFKNPRPHSPGSVSEQLSISKDIGDAETARASSEHPRHESISIDALRLIELTERTSAVLRGQSADLLIRQDPVLNVIRTFGQLNQIHVSASLSVVPVDDYPNSIAAHARNASSQMVVVPLSLPASDTESSGVSSSAYNPFESFFRVGSSASDAVSAVAASQIIRRVFSNSPADVTLFIDKGLSLKSDRAPHFFLPFFGGPDDRLALSLVVQICLNPLITATVVRIRKKDSDEQATSEKEANLAYGNTLAFPDTVYGAQTPQSRLQSETADNIAWNTYAGSTSVHSPDISAALDRIEFNEESTPRPLHQVLEISGRLVGARAVKPLFIVAGRSRRMAVDSHKQELLHIAKDRNVPISSELPKTFGEVGAAFVATEINASLLVVQAAAAPS